MAISFEWKLTEFDNKFKQRCHDLEAFKTKFGHCNIPQRYSVDPSLGHWCNQMRVAYNQIQQGNPMNCKLSQDRIVHLKEIGFKWKVNDGKFEQRFRALEAFKTKFGHCNVS